MTMYGVTHDVGKWDLLIAHPPCTYLSNAGARFLYPKGVLNEQRLRKGLMAKDFFLHFLWSDIPQIAVECLKLAGYIDGVKAVEDIKN